MRQYRLFFFPLGQAKVNIHLFSIFLLVSLLGEGCHSRTNISASSDGPTDTNLRFYLISDVGGVIEPCGCVKDQMGGIAQAASFLKSGQLEVPDSVLIGAGPLFFKEVNLSDDKKWQEIASARLLANSFSRMGLVAFSPGLNDFGEGMDQLRALVQRSQACALLSNAADETEAGSPIFTNQIIKEVSGIKIGLIGVMEKDDQHSIFSSSPKLQDRSLADVVHEMVRSLKDQKVQMIFLLGSLNPGEAKRIADKVPGITVILIGSRVTSEEVNTDFVSLEKVWPEEEDQKQEKVGALIVQLPNHLQGIGVLDFHVRGDLFFVDESGLKLAAKDEQLGGKIRDLNVRLAIAQQDRASQQQIDVLQSELKQLQADRISLMRQLPSSGKSYFRYRVQEIRDSMRKDPDVSADLEQYYRSVNEHNRIIYANKKPPAPSPGQAYYVGGEKCKDCHLSAHLFWEKTPHARAYATLANQAKEFNLDCVGCHVTGYERPGGSTVTWNTGLQNVQCESCHGPGSIHVQTQRKEDTVLYDPALCIDCHHPPHVHEFDVDMKKLRVLGPGHGQ
ncbi:multiheme c-type cytochrome [Pajaroellobacter abortibovis]|uniref:Cytochrome c-552/4 domain-containing protein n=1 Tax=Pajaroellobacter abortibovis TaxID=1882918 RepID=A0A1L6MXF7_9BACT|nr:multiheme c-type cytochrome [Pajaroellobacter abortibovis]APS00261.1 hypothetical protein BCY86_05855 [Pajaroellobacter abortibovis]